MKRGAIVLLLLGVLLVFPLIQAQEQYQTYSGFDRFIDNVKLFFYSGDKDVKLALQIREKEVNAAMNNIQNQNKESAIKNLERARDKLQLVQERVSVGMAGEVETSVSNMVTRIDEQGNILEEFELYKLEEEKTQLTAKLVIEVDGKEGQTLIREIVKNMTTGRKELMITVRGENGEETIVTEIQGEMNQINNEIQTRIVEMGMAKGTTVDGGGSGGNVVDSGNDVVKTGMDVDVDKIDPNAGPKTPVPTDGSICCKKTKYGETRYHWDSEEDCLNPVNIKGEVMDNDVCVALGSEVLDEEDPESWGSVDGGVPEACVEQGAYDDEACARIMEMVEICCRKTIDGEAVYEWVPGKICVSPYGDRVDEDSCLG